MNQPLTDEEIAALKNLHADSTDGVWEGSSDGVVLRIEMDGEFRYERELGNFYSPGAEDEPNAAFAATAHNLTPRLLDELTALRDATRWRLPDEKTGEWKELPEHGKKIVITLQDLCDGEYWESRGYYNAETNKGFRLKADLKENRMVAWRYDGAEPYSPSETESTPTTPAAATPATSEGEG